MLDAHEPNAKAFPDGSSETVTDGNTVRATLTVGAFVDAVACGDMVFGVEACASPTADATASTAITTTTRTGLVRRWDLGALL